MSGYADAGRPRAGDVKTEHAFLQKPFTPVGLAQKVRERARISELHVRLAARRRVELARHARQRWQAHLVHRNSPRLAERSIE